MSLSSRLLAPVYDRLMRGSEQLCLAAWRAELLAPLSGVVLDVGAGTGANLPHYGARITRLIASEPDRHMRRRLATRAKELGLRDMELSDASLDALPMADETFDAVVATLVMCSVADPGRALGEIRRVLKPRGRLVFIEHVGAHDNPDRLRWQRRVEPVWRHLFGNCHLTRDTASAIEDAGFTIEHIERASIRKAASVARPSVRGMATKSG